MRTFKSIRSLFSLGAITALLLLLCHWWRRREEVRKLPVMRLAVQPEIKELLSLASHELKTPLTTIRGTIQLLARRFPDGGVAGIWQADPLSEKLGEEKRLLQRADQQITRLTRVINNLLEMAGLYTDTIEFSTVHSDLRTLTQETVGEMLEIFPQRMIRLEIATEKSVMVLLDRRQMKLVISHYLSNAHKFSPPDSPVVVWLGQQDQMARLTVHDEGPGIPEREQERIWEPFYRVPGIPIQNDSEIGLGLGLYVCRSIIGRHHGEVGVDSTPGSGATFWFMVPAHALA